MKDALLAIRDRRSASSGHVRSNGLTHDQTAANQEGQASLWQQGTESDEEEWVRPDV